jgi:hypothetical protein
VGSRSNVRRGNLIESIPVSDDQPEIEPSRDSLSPTLGLLSMRPEYRPVSHPEINIPEP